MFGFGKKKPLSPEVFAESVGDVERRIAQGDYESASQAAAALRKATEANNGAHTLMWANAHFLEARTAFALGESAEAMEHMRLAIEIHDDDDDAVKARLTYEMNLGDILSELGELDDAEQVHRRALEERRLVFGENDPGFGYGAESLGTVLLRKGEYDEAATLAQAAVEAFRGGEPHKLDATLILWMLAEKSRRPDDPVLTMLSAEDHARLLDAIARAPAYLFIDATIDLRWEVVRALDDDDRKLSCLMTIAKHSAALARSEDQARALEEHAVLVATREANE